MPSDFPSIDELLKQPKPAPPAAGVSAAPPSQTAGPSDVLLQERMAQIRLKELEVAIAQNAASKGMPYIDLKGFPINPDALRLMPEETAAALKAICFLYTPTEIRFGAVDPNDPKVKEELAALTAKTGTVGGIYMISEESLRQGMKLYATLPKIREVSYSVEIGSGDIDKYQSYITNFHDLDKIIAKTNITELVSLLIAAAVKINSSDIHVEAEEKNIIVRYRIDGVLEQAAVIEKSRWHQIISRLKLLAGLKLNITDRPQDGRITITIKGEKVEVRVSTLPTAFGESVVMRILKSTAASLKFEDLGVKGKAAIDLEREMRRPNGMIITTGPTGSGKTTTLYAILNTLNLPGVKIITLEDPVEYKLQGVAQSQIDPSRDYTFAKGLRSILRQDPNIIMVGEIRDLETAEIAVQAALTGHLVISTIHTNSAAGAIPRFLSMGVKGVLLAPALNAVIGQRLVRRLHDCKVPVELEASLLTRVKQALESISPLANTKIDLANLKFWGPKGCEICNHTGYKGRVGIYEIFTMSKEIETVILSNSVSEYTMQDLAIKQGMVNMLQDGLLKALEGTTSVEEIFKVAE
ncbi:MAG: GspE/PulE family protein [bacterium]